jgi:hypothetical protein
LKHPHRYVSGVPSEGAIRPNIKRQSGIDFVFERRTK